MIADQFARFLPRKVGRKKSHKTTAAKTSRNELTAGEPREANMEAEIAEELCTPMEPTSTNNAARPPAGGRLAICFAG
ncbi:hypothetical protein GCM10010525_09740 [Glutamicibacter bergerei]